MGRGGGVGLIGEGRGGRVVWVRGRRTLWVGAEAAYGRFVGGEAAYGRFVPGERVAWE